MAKPRVAPDATWGCGSEICFPGNSETYVFMQLGADGMGTGGE